MKSPPLVILLTILIIGIDATGQTKKGDTINTYLKIIEEIKNNDTLTIYNYSFQENLNHQYLGKQFAENDHKNGIEFIFLTKPSYYHPCALCILKENKIQFVFDGSIYFEKTGPFKDGYNEATWKYITKRTGLKQCHITDTIPQLRDFSFWNPDTLFKTKKINDSTVIVKSYKNSFSPWEGMVFNIQTSKGNKHIITQQDLIYKGFYSHMDKNNLITFRLSIKRRKSSKCNCEYSNYEVAKIDIFHTE